MVPSGSQGGCPGAGNVSIEFSDLTMGALHVDRVHRRIAQIGHLHQLEWGHAGGRIDVADITRHVADLRWAQSRPRPDEGAHIIGHPDNCDVQPLGRGDMR